MGYRDGNAVDAAEPVLQEVLPRAAAGSVAAASVGQDQQAVNSWKSSAAVKAPPRLDAVHGELRRVMGGPDEDRGCVRDRQVNAIGDGDAFGVGSEVVIQDGTTLQRPFLPAFLNSPTCSFFFVSMLMIGRPSASNVLRSAAIFRNWSSRSAGEQRAIVFAFARSR